MGNLGVCRLGFYRVSRPGIVVLFMVLHRLRRILVRVLYGGSENCSSVFRDCWGFIVLPSS